MPVKVRCPECSKVLAAPDAARGKAIRCPDCQTKIPVPAGEQAPASSGKSPTSKPPAASTGKVPTQKSRGTPAVPKAKVDLTSDNFLAALDLRHAEDRSGRICAKCGQPVGEDDLECPACGMNSRTGQMTAIARKRLTQKGPDKAEYWKGAWKDPWQFTLHNKSLWLRSMMYAILSGLLVAGCLYMAFFVCERLPPRTFWLAFAFAGSLVFPGWLWHLTMTIIQRTMSRKQDAGTVHFDIFLNMSLGLKIIIWQIVVFAIPAGIVSSPVAWIPIIGWIVAAGVSCIFDLLIPISLCHMAMPVTKPGWISFTMFPAFFRSFGGTLYTWVVLLVANLLPLLLWGAAIGIQIVQIGKALTEWFEKWLEPPPAEAVAGAATGAADAAGAAASAFPLTFMSVGLPAILYLLGIIAFCITAVYCMRVLGLYAYYFHNELELITEPPDEQFVRQLPHRGTLLLWMAIFGCWFPYIGGIAYKLALTDLEDMKSGRRDPAGRKRTKLAVKISQINTAIWLILTVYFVLAWSFEIWPFEPKPKEVEEQVAPGAAPANPANNGIPPINDTP